MSRNNIIRMGLNPIVLESDTPGAEMDLYILKLSKGDFYSFREKKETGFILLEGSVKFEWSDGEAVAERGSCFSDEPVFLNAPAGETVKITSLGLSAQVAVQMVKNNRQFTTVYKTPETIESFIKNPTEAWGAIKRRSRIINPLTDTYSNLHTGELVLPPGKWGSWPPHHHHRPEIYFYKFKPSDGFGVYADDGEGGGRIFENDALLFTNGASHAQVTTPGYAMYYLWMIPHLDGARHTGNYALDYEWTVAKDAKIVTEFDQE